uniref:Haloacid dehalogenase-like hydrolase n=1 Tax=Amorphochlora amoebiformis TaxID=1561963 RepID=A0A7S0H659_9EUKA
MSIFKRTHRYPRSANILKSSIPTGRSIYRFVALDLDGTTLNTKHQLSKRNIAAIRSMVEKGVGVAIATGRSMSGIYEHLETLQLPYPIPVLCLNGALALKGTCDGKTQPLFTDPVPKDLVSQVVSLGQETGDMIQFYVDDKVYALPLNEEHQVLMKRYQVLTGHPQTQLRDVKELKSIGQPAKILLLTNDADGLMEKAKNRFGNKLHLVRGSPEPFFVEFLQKGVCKGTGLLKLCQVEKIDPSSIVAFGDGDNDMEFLQNAGFGIAMKNAREVTKDKADMVLPYTNDQDGVGRQIEDMLSEGSLVGCDNLDNGHSLEVSKRTEFEHKTAMMK